MEILSLDLENANAKNVKLNQEILMLRSQLAATGQDSRFGELEAQTQHRLAEKESHINALEKSLKEKTEFAAEEMKGLQNSVRDLERELKKLKIELAESRNQLLEYSDYEEIKKELDIFKEIEVSQGVLGQELPANVPLERLLLDKNKRLENDFTSIKVDIVNSDGVPNVE
jgi:homeobox protein cut-like